MKHPKNQDGTSSKRTKAEIVFAGKNNNKCIGPCPYCTTTMIVGNLKRMPTRDHIFPQSRFPNSKRTIIVCSECNFMKGDHTLSEFLQMLQDRNKRLLMDMQANAERIKNIDYLIRIGLEEE